MNRALTIFVSSSSSPVPETNSTGYQKWASFARAYVVPTIGYEIIPREKRKYWAPKLGHPIEQSILSKLCEVSCSAGDLIGPGTAKIYHRTTGGLYWKVFTDFAPAFKVNGKCSHSSRETSFSLRNKGHLYQLIALLSSDLFWWWYTVTGNLRDLNPSDIQNFPVPKSALEDDLVKALGQMYVEDINSKSTMSVREQRQTGRIETQSFKIQESKSLLDQIDTTIAKHYCLSNEELDFIINYDIKYRMGLIQGGDK